MFQGLFLFFSKQFLVSKLGVKLLSILLGTKIFECVCFYINPFLSLGAFFFFFFFWGGGGASLGLSDNDTWEPPESPLESSQEASEGNRFTQRILIWKNLALHLKTLISVMLYLAKMEKDKLPNFLFREALIFGTVFQVWSKMAWNEKSRRYMFRETIFSNLDNLRNTVQEWLEIKIYCLWLFSIFHVHTWWGQAKYVRKFEISRANFVHIEKFSLNFMYSHAKL